MFEKASRMKLRFATPRGMLTVEDLWDLPLLAGNNQRNMACLDDLAKAINRELKNSDEESFVIKQTAPNEELNLKFGVVKHIIKVRLEEAEKAESLALAQAQKQKILGIIARKQDEALEGKSLDELRALVEAL